VDAAEGSARAQREMATLDGLRGLAAFAVVLMHVSVLAPHAYLAVDLFFVLSGFVLEHAYGARLSAGWSPVDFMRKRVRRLYPLYALALTISVLAVGAALLLHRGAGWTPGGLAAAAVTGAFMAPLWGPGEAHLYPLNFPAWTLLAELAANAVYGWSYRRLSAPMLFAWTLACGLLLGRLVLGHGTLNAGAAWADFPIGLARVGFAFPLGVMLRRMAPRTLPPLAGLLALLAACAVLYAPFGGAQAPVYDLLAAVIAWPVLIAVGAASSLKGVARAIAVELGAASYGVYVTAVPVFILVHAVLRARGLKTDTLPWLGALAFCCALFGAAFVVRRLTGRKPAGA
jgi:peptidoglycan/LPS O-acetylase OafA/YrhL